MPYSRKRRRQYARGSRKRSRAASSIAAAWRARKRRKTSLFTKTLLANRRAVRRLNKCVETKMISGVDIQPTNGFKGQYVQNLIVDNVGQFIGPGTSPYANDLLGGLQQGTQSDERIGAWIHLKSITLHYSVIADQTSPQAHVNFLLVHDSDPQSAANLTQLLTLQSASPPPLNWTQLAFQSLDETGKGGRYKLLWRKTHVVSCASTLADSSTAVPPIVTTAQPAPGGGTYSNVTRATYTNQPVNMACKQYPLCVYGTKTFRLKYKINYGQRPASDLPENQSLKLFCFQTAPIGQPQPSARIDYYARVRFHDA